MENKIKRRILFVITQSELGGAQQFFNNFIPKLDPEHYHCLVAIGRDGDGSLHTTLQAKSVATQSLNQLRRDDNWLSDFKAVHELRALIKHFQPDVLFLNSSKAGFIGALAARWPTRLPWLKVVYRIGGWTFNDPWPRWRKWFYILLEKISAHWKDWIVVNNQKDSQLAEQLGIKPRQRLVYIPNGIDPYLEFIPRTEARAKLFTKFKKTDHTADLVVGTIGNFYPAKDTANFIRAAARITNPEAVFVIIGDGELRPELEKLIRELRQEDRIFLLGRISEAQRYLKALDVFVLPSCKEGFPWTVLEAMSAQVPVVATAVGAVPELVDSGENGLVVSINNPNSLARNIESLLNSERLRQGLAIAAHQKIIQNFTQEQMVRRFTHLLDEVVSSL